MNVYAKQKQTHRHRKQTCGYHMGGANQKYGIDMHTLPCVK